MAEIRNLTRNGETFYPLTVADAVSDPNGEFFGYYADNPEWIRVILDNDKKVLGGIKSTGEIEWSLGIPTPVKDYVQENLEALFQQVDESKVDKEEGKSLIDSEYASGISYQKGLEYIDVKVDEDGKILEGNKSDCSKLFNTSVNIKSGDLTLGNIKLSDKKDPEFIETKLDSEGRILEGRKKDGLKFESLDYRVDGGFYINETHISNNNDPEERIAILTDSEGKIVSYRGVSGDLYESSQINVPKINLGGTVENNIEDPENRVTMLTDSEGKVISYRDKQGNLVETIGINTNSLTTNELESNTISLAEEGQEYIKDLASSVVEEKALLREKKYYLPRFGYVNIFEETFYLDAHEGFNTKNDVVLIQMLDDTDLNGNKRLTLSYYYLKNEDLIPTASGDYDRTSVTANSIQLDLHAGKDVVAIDDKFFATAIYTPVINSSGYITDYTKNKATKVIDQTTGDVIGYEYEGHSTEVKQIKDVPPYKAWKVNKNIEHYCLAEIDFGYFYSTDPSKPTPVSIKYQGSGSTAKRKRGFRLTFYKKNDYAKKDKVKIGEMVRLSGYNLKSYPNDRSRIKDPIISNLLMEIWESRGYDCYPWNKTKVLYNGATGMIKSFPIETKFGTEFFGLQMFSVKKDEHNYMLDGDHDASGIFVSGDINGDHAWENASPRDWEDELDAEDKIPAYNDLPGGRTSVSVETAAALTDFFKYTKGFVSGSIVLDGKTLDISSGIFYKDLENNVYDKSEVTTIDYISYVSSTLDPETGEPTQESTVVSSVDFAHEVLEEHLDLASWIDYWIGLQIFFAWDNTYHNIILYSGEDKKKFYTYFYDLDDAMATYTPNTTGLIENLTDPETSVYPYGVLDMSFWIKFTDTYKDSIINRYSELRKNILSIKNIDNIYKTYISEIPQSVIEDEKTRWGNGDPYYFDTLLNRLQSRLEWLDSNYFNLK